MTELTPNKLANQDIPHNLAKRKIWPAIWRGLKMRCPECGEGHIYRQYLKIRDDCPKCGLHLAGHEADDAPPYFTIFIVGHILVPTALIVERLYMPPLWVHAAIFSVLSMTTALLTLPLVKGGIVGLQWALRLHGFEQASDEHEGVVTSK
ncbi:DUF983 domain-containing protein [Alphaproteobacteria bacterium]|jgi:uncharacterized protein (DUF983 family)|nr:DUF983 domain-containing protein [Alphaproteobacteria bacterium]